MFARRATPEARRVHARVLLRTISRGQTMTDLAIVTEKLTRRFGALTAVDNVDLRVRAGQVFGFLGPNGAGKSTTIKMLTGLLAPTSGRMQLLGLDFSSHTIEVKRQIGERLCSHVGIIHQGRLVAQDSIEELRAGIAGKEGSKTTLEQIFLSIVGQSGAERTQIEELSWLT